ncbi:MAG: ABC transporter ATP-binding protein [Cyclobacteriaceae bacterium]
MSERDYESLEGKTSDKQSKVRLNKSSFKSLLGIYQFIVPYRWQFVVGIVSLVFSSLTLLSFPLASGELIDVASGKDSWIGEDINTIALLLLGIFLVQSIFSFIRVYYFAQVNERAMADVRLAIYGKLMSLPMPFFDQRRSGELISRITADVSLLQSTFSTTLAEFLRQIATLLIGITVIMIMAPRLTLFMLATFPVLVLLAVLFGKRIRMLSRKTQDELADANIIVEETLQAIQAVKSFTGELTEIKKYNHALSVVVNTALKAATYRGFFISFVIFALFGGIVAVIWYGASLVQEGAITIGELISFILYTTLIGGSIAGLGDLYGQIQRAVGASERVLDILNEPSELDPTEYYKAKQSPSLRGDISFRSVTFSYPTRTDVVVLDDISFQIRHGEKIALVGHSGAGKSTITQLLLRFYQASSGTISVNDVAVDQYDLLQYRSHIGLVPQEVILFGGTIKENIAYGKPGASLEEIETAARQANAHEFIESFPEGYLTKVGERGVKLSGGQRQRIAIARAILKNPSILILDEATSSLDAESEHLVQQALERLMQNRTTIIIAHRLATIKKVDRIYVLKAGKIVETGTHEELYTQRGDYSNLVKLQLEAE